jgi:hypothetical protein
MKVGSIVRPKNGIILRCSLYEYNSAVVISLDPFILVSMDTNMRWSTKDPKDFEVYGSALKELLNKCQRRLIN